MMRSAKAEQIARRMCLLQRAAARRRRHDAQRQQQQVRASQRRAAPHALPRQHLSRTLPRQSAAARRAVQRARRIFRQAHGSATALKLRRRSSAAVRA
jgi:hypothetical protein